MTITLLRSTQPIDLDEVPALVFGHLVKLAAPVVENYHSDLYHDALWIQRHLTGESFTFLYSVGVNGTNIGQDATVNRRELTYRITAQSVNGDVTLTIEELAP